MGWLIALGVIAALLTLPVGIRLVYNENGLVLSLLLGLVKIRIFPKPVKNKNTQIKPKKRRTKQISEKSKGKSTASKGGKLSDFLPLIETVLEFLVVFRRKLRINRLKLLLTLAAEDPCDLAINYGRAWAAVGNLMPLLERTFVIRKRNVQVQCDFLEESTRITAEMDAVVSVGRLLVLVTRYGVRVLREYQNILKLRKGGASL